MIVIELCLGVSTPELTCESGTLAQTREFFTGFPGSPAICEATDTRGARGGSGARGVIVSTRDEAIFFARPLARTEATGIPRARAATFSSASAGLAKESSGRPTDGGGAGVSWAASREFRGDAPAWRG